MRSRQTALARDLVRALRFPASTRHGPNREHSSFRSERFQTSGARPAARHPRARISGAHVALARADTPCAAVSKCVLSHAITANRPRARSRARAPFPGFKTRRDLNRNLGEAQKSHAARKPRRSTRARRVLRSCSPWCAVDSGACARGVGATVVHQPGASEATTRDVLPAAPALSRRPQT